MNITFLYIAVAAMAIYYIFFKIIPFFRKAKKVTKSLFSKIHINKNSTCTDEEYKKIAIGAIYSEQQVAYINSLTTGLDKSGIKESLSEWWGINNNSDAEDKLDYLFNKGFRFYFNAIYKAYLAGTPEEQQNIITSSFNQSDLDYEEDVEKAFGQLNNLKETWEQLTRNAIVSSKEELVKYNNLGWDCGRLVFLSRLCLDADYISENKAWEYIDKANELAVQNFSDWESFSKSYIIGRGMWGGIESANEGIMGIADDLLTEEKSPWVKFSLQ